MIFLLVGLRGVGKSRLLQRLISYFPASDVAAVDLDAEIAAAEGMTVQAIFALKGERYFRELERLHLARVVDELNSGPWTRGFVTVGAGFEGELPEGTRCLWVRRETDHLGRIFMDRPRLDQHLTPLQEYDERRLQRLPRYQAWAHEELTLLEGFRSPYEAEEEYFRNQIADCQGILTVLPTVYQHESEVLEFFKRRLGWGVRYFELRDDLLTPQQMQWTKQVLPPDRILVSLRQDSTQLSPPQAQLWDWPLEWAGYPGSQSPPVVSLHQRTHGESLAACLLRLETLGYGSQILKAAPEVHNLSELVDGHNWVMLDPKRRTFLPRSPDGRWRWYRLWMKNRMALNFWREGEGSSPDQPLLLEWLQNDFTTRWFAAVLGDPVEHSWTPAYHYEFFQMRGLPVFRISVTSEEWKNGALAQLEKLGLRYAAVTSPLKEFAYSACASVTENARKFQSVNTLRWSPEGWAGANTDETGLHLAFSHFEHKKIAVWGGGGTLGPLHSILPNARFYSARTGEPRGEVEASDGWRPEVIVWAVGRSHMATSKWPPSEWRPEIVLDLNYTENSPAREYALQMGCGYQPGDDMFYAQASAQQEFWK